jgi:hypothetical protein
MITMSVVQNCTNIPLLMFYVETRLYSFKTAILVKDGFSMGIIFSTHSAFSNHSTKPVAGFFSFKMD